MSNLQHATRNEQQEYWTYPAEEKYPRLRLTDGKKIILLFLIGILVLILSPAALRTPESTNMALGRNGSSIIDASQATVKAPRPLEEYREANLPPLYNRELQFSAEKAPKLASVGFNPARQEQFMEAKASTAFLRMKADAAAEGINLVPLSGYRNHQEQINIYNLKIQHYLAQGYSHEQAVKETQLYHAVPGTSEHEAGLAIDVNSLEENFEDSAEFLWLKRNAANYGFILRYPKNKTAVTKVAFEPWHYRYVGSNHAAKIVQGQLTLEEYLKNLG